MRLPPRPKALDISIAAVLICVSQAETWLGKGLQPRLGVAVFEGLSAVLIAWRRIAPRTTVILIGIASVGLAATGTNLEKPAVNFLCLLFAVYTVASYVPLRRSLTWVAPVLVLTATQLTIAHRGIDNLTFLGPFIAFALLMGRTVQHRSDEAVAVSLRAERLTQERHNLERAAVAAERSRIARELHDIVSHSVSLMVVQAGAAAEILRKDMDRAEQAMRVVEATGRSAIAELATMLGVLRDSGEAIGLAPIPNLAQLPALVEETRAAGIPTGIEIVGTARPLEAASELAIYRIVQEALTNVRKHGGPGTTASITLAYEADALVAEVVDDGGGSVEVSTGTGHGVIGLRERAESVGGRVEIGPRPGRGFAVRASVPAARA